MEHRRGFLGKALALLGLGALAGTAKAAAPAGPADTIQGVGVIRYPANLPAKEAEAARQQAQAIAGNIRPGSILALPNTRDSYGAYEWDFRIEGGDPGQVKVERAVAEGEGLDQQGPVYRLGVNGPVVRRNPPKGA